MCRLLSLVVAVVAVASGCQGRPTNTVPPLALAAGCSPLLHEISCGLPYPSDFFLIDDATLPSGHRVAIDGAAELSTTEGRSADITEFMPQDGFSRLPPIVWSFGVRVDGSSVPDITADPGATIVAGYPLALLNTNDGSRVPFFVDVDPRANDDAREALIMRPLVRLQAETRYVVVVSGVRAVTGELPVPLAMQRLIGGVDAVGNDAVLSPLSARYERDVFPIVVGAGIAREAVQLAWDFTTGSDAHVQHDLLRGRSLALASLAQTAPTATITGFLEGEQIGREFSERANLSWRLIKLRVTGPRIVESDDAGTLLARDDAGDVRLNGTTTFDALVVIPATVRDDDSAAVVELYGHGFFGDRGELQYSSIRELPGRAKRVQFAIDWLGMSFGDLGVVAGSMGDTVSEALRFGERLPQAMVNWLTLTELIKRHGLDDLVTVVGGTNEVKPFRRPVTGDGSGSGDGSVLVDASDIAFVGNSQGHILGAVAAALNGDVKRVILSVGGEGFSHMMFRARPFQGFTFFLDRTVVDPLDQQLLTAHLQRAADRFDPATWAPYLLDEEVPEGPANNAVARRLLFQFGRGDSQVPNLGALLHIRTLGLPWATPGAFDAPWGLTTATLPFEGSAAYQFDFGVDPSFEVQATFPPAENRVHYSVASSSRGQQQSEAFLRDGVIINPCAPDVCAVIP